MDEYLAEAKLLLTRTQNDLRAAFAELSAAIGSSKYQTFDLVEESLPAAPPLGQTELINAAIRNRPELAALLSDRDSVYQFQKAESALKKPTLSAIWNVRSIPVRDGRLSNHYNALEVNITIPIFNGGLLKPRSAEAAYKARAADENVKDTENRIVRDVRVAWLNASITYQRIELAEQLLNRAREAADLARERYRMELSSIVELSQALLSLTVAEIENTNVRVEYLIQLSILDYQSGQLR
jgi:outer membrane protein